MNKYKKLYQEDVQEQLARGVKIEKARGLAVTSVIFTYCRDVGAPITSKETYNEAMRLIRG